MRYSILISLIEYEVYVESSVRGYHAYFKDVTVLGRSLCVRLKKTTTTTNMLSLQGPRSGFLSGDLKENERMSFNSRENFWGVKRHTVTEMKSLKH